MRADLSAMFKRYLKIPPFSLRFSNSCVITQKNNIYISRPNNHARCFIHLIYSIWKNISVEISVV